jgi:hypothetical protein
LKRFGRSLQVDPSDADAIANGIVRLHDEYDSFANAPVDRPFVESFEWGALTARLDEAMTRLITR